MNLSARLLKVLDFINPSDIVADIGADHGYLSLAMLEKGVSHVQIVENKTEPLKRAQSNLLDHDNVSFSLSDGISDLESEINTVTICGMGGLNIVEILSNSISTAKKLKKIVLQANSKNPELRKYLFDNGFSIDDEEIAKEEVHGKAKYYEIIVCHFTGSSYPYNFGELYLGPIMIKKHSSLFIEKYKKEKEEYLEILANPEFKNEEGINDLKNKIDIINRYIGE